MKPYKIKYPLFFRINVAKTSSVKHILIALGFVYIYMYVESLLDLLTRYRLCKYLSNAC